MIVQEKSRWHLLMLAPKESASRHPPSAAEHVRRPGRKIAAQFAIGFIKPSYPVRCDGSCAFNVGAELRD
jgi:hypothetical protein